MNEAKNLKESPPEIDRPGSSGPEVFASSAEPAVGLEAAVTIRTAHAVTTAPRRRRSRGAANALLVLSLIGLLAFGAGAALALAMLDGMLDLQTGWVKDALSTLKDVAQHFKK